MPLYIMLSSLSETGRQVLRKLPGSIRKVNAGLVDPFEAESVVGMLSTPVADLVEV